MYMNEGELDRLLAAAQKDPKCIEEFAMTLWESVLDSWRGVKPEAIPQMGVRTGKVKEAHEYLRAHGLEDAIRPNGRVTFKSVMKAMHSSGVKEIVLRGDMFPYYPKYRLVKFSVDSGERTCNIRL